MVLRDDYLVVDVDGPNFPRRLQAVLVDADRTLCAPTPRAGGWRYVFRVPEGWADRLGRGSRKKLITGDDGEPAGDVRVGAGFYFVGCGSGWWSIEDVNDFRRYAWPREWEGVADADAPGVFEFAEAPAALLRLIPAAGYSGIDRPAGGARAAGGSGGGGFRERWPIPVRRGMHDDYLAAWAAHLRRRGFSEERAFIEWEQAVAEHLEGEDPAWPFGVDDFRRHWSGAAAKFEAAAVGVGGPAAPSRGRAGERIEGGVEPEVEVEGSAGGGKQCAVEGCSAMFAPDRNRRYCPEHSPADRREAVRRAAGDAWAAAVGVFGRPVWLGGDAEGGFGWWQTSEPEGWVPLPESALRAEVEAACGGDESVAGAALRGTWPAVMQARLTARDLQGVLLPEVVRSGWPVEVDSGRVFEGERWANGWGLRLTVDGEGVWGLESARLGAGYWSRRAGIPHSLPEVEGGDVLEGLRAWAAADGGTPGWDRLTGQLPEGEADYLLVLCGRALLRADYPHELVSLYGRGGTGKSTVTGVLAGVIGAEVAADVVQLASRFGAARLVEARIVTLPELPPMRPSGSEADRRALARIKSLASGDVQAIEHKYLSRVESLKLVPLVVASSNFPAGWAGSPVDREAWIRRLSPFLFDARPDRVDARLGARVIRAEGRRLAVRAVVAYVDWRNGEGRRPGSVELRAEAVVDAGLSTVARWAVRRLELDHRGEVSLDALVADFLRYGADSGGEVGDPKIRRAVGRAVRRLTGRGSDRARSGDGRVRVHRGVRLLPEPEGEPSSSGGAPVEVDPEAEGLF